MKKKPFIIAAAVIVLSSVAGLLIGNAIFLSGQSSKPARRSEIRKQETLSKLELSVEVGDKLPDSDFKTLAGELIHLKDVVKNPTIVVFIHHVSAYSRKQLKEFRQVAECVGSDRYLTIISKSPIADLAAIRNEFGLGSMILYDENGEYEKMLGVTIFPFNFVVDADLKINAMEPGVIDQTLFKYYCLSFQNESG